MLPSKTKNTESTDKICHGIAFAELVSYTEDLRADDDIASILMLRDLTEMYSTRLEQLGVAQTSRINSTKLKNRILGQFPDMSDHKEGRDVLLAFNKDIGFALKKAHESNYDEEAICLTKAANIVRREMLQMKSKFTGSFEPECQVRSVPKSLLALVGMILDGPDIKSQSAGITQAALSTAQLLQYNSHTRRRTASKYPQHNKDRETPLPIYVGLTVHAKTSKRDLVDTLFQLGLSISYDRVMSITTALGNRVCEYYHQGQTVCPMNLRCNLFTTAAIDNIDHNPSSTSASGSFHGTGISLFQHPNRQNKGSGRRGAFPVLEISVNTRQVSELPESYTTIRPVQLKKTDVLVHKVSGLVKGNGGAVTEALDSEIRWLQSVESNIMDDTQKGNISWAAYHDSHLPKAEITPAISALLPLFPDDSKSASMIRHAMDVIWQAVQEVNPGQTPVITLDQPLYTIAKQIQWNWPTSHGEDHFVIVLGGLHIEKAGLQMVGDWLKDSGWVEALVQSKVASSGTADSFLKASHITHTR